MTPGWRGGGDPFRRRAWLVSAGGAASLIALYGLVHIVIGLTTTPSLALDDAKLNVLVQSFQAGYLVDNPPLYEWMLGGVQRVSGPGLFSFLFLKYALWLVTAMACRQTLRLAGCDHGGATAGAIGLVLFYQYGWNYHQAFTHSLALIATTALFWWALIALVRAPRLSGYVLLGVMLGLGAIAKYSFAPAALIALGAAASHADGRRALLHPFLAVTALTAMVIVAPHVHWALGDGRALGETLEARFLENPAPYAARLASGLPQSLWAVVSFFLPAVAVFFVLFRAHVWRGVHPWASTSGAVEPILLRAALAGVAALPFAVIVLGLADIQERYAVGLLYPAALFMLAQVLRLCPGAAGRVLAASGAVIVVIMGVRIAQGVVAGPPFCSKCRQFVPYEALFAKIDEAGWAEADLVAMNDLTAGNVRRLAPRARVRSAHLPAYTPPRMGEGPCIFIWSDELGAPAPALVTDAVLPQSLVRVDAPWPRDARAAMPRRTIWHFGEVDPAKAIKKDLCG